MRRILAILAVVAAVVVAGATAAAAHPYLQPDQVGVGQPVSLRLIVEAELPTPMTDIAVTAPAGFRVTGSSPATGWSVDSANPLHFTGSTPFGLTASFAIEGVPTVKMTEYFGVLVKSAEGSQQNWAGADPHDEFPAVALYAGTRPDLSVPGAGKQNTTLRNIGLGAVAAGFLLALGFFVFRHRLFARAPR